VQLDLTDEEMLALFKLLTDTIEADRYPLSPRIQILHDILAKVRTYGTGATGASSAANTGGT
jgi:hypothetical protein